MEEEAAMKAPAAISVTRRTRPLAYRVTRQAGSGRYMIRDPFGAAIDGVPT
jgi:hypothetical protein